MSTVPQRVRCWRNGFARFDRTEDGDSRVATVANSVYLEADCRSKRNPNVVDAVTHFEVGEEPAAEGRGLVAYPTCFTKINGVDLAVHAAVRKYDYLLEMIDFQR